RMAPIGSTASCARAPIRLRAAPPKSSGTSSPSGCWGCPRDARRTHRSASPSPQIEKGEVFASPFFTTGLRSESGLQLYVPTHHAAPLPADRASPAPPAIADFACQISLGGDIQHMLEALQFEKGRVGCGIWLRSLRGHGHAQTDEVAILGHDALLNRHRRVRRLL